VDAIDANGRYSANVKAQIMKAASQLALGTFLLATGVLQAPTSRAIDLNGAWATEAGLCAKVFVKKGQGITFAPLSDLYGSGLIIDNAHIRGKIARCSIKSRTEDGASLRIRAACATRIVVSQEEFSLKIVGDDGFTRTFIGVPGLEVTYRRCAL
jgi:hypothetical protein